MNRSFKVIFNQSTGTYVAVPEIAKAGGKGTKSVVSLAVMATLLLAGGQAEAGPIGGVVASGTAQISKNKNTTTINQSSDRAIINWQGFDVSKNETVQFNQKNVNSVILNRVLSATPSMIDGAINANGKVFIVNAAGIVVGKNANINVGGLTLSSLNINNSDFMSGKDKFSGQSPANVSNAGNITASEGGFVAMIGGQVTNSGVIVAKEGMVALASGSAATLTIGQGATAHTLVVDSGTVDALINVGGAIRVDGGQIVLSAHAVNSLLKNIINQIGVLEANSIKSVGGKIIIDGGDSGIVNLAGTINAQGQKGGTVVASGDQVLLTGKISATGQSTGGNVYIGGGIEGKDTSITNAKEVAMTKSASIDVSSTNNGQGGNAVLWSEDSTQFSGDIKAKGGKNGGDGGYIETSGHNLGFNGTVHLDSAKGTAGNLLLDPDIIIISNAASGAQDASLPTITATATDPNGTKSTVSVNALEAITSGTISLQANGYIQVQDLTLNGGDGEINLKPNVNLKLTTISNGGTSSYLPAVANYSASGYGGIEFVNNANGIVASGTGAVTLTGGNSVAPRVTAVSANAQTVNIGHITTDSGAITLQGADGLSVLGNLTTNTGNITLDGDSDQGGVGFLNVTSNFKTNSGAVYLKGGYGSTSGVAVIGNVGVGTGTLTFAATSGSTFAGTYSILGSVSALGNFSIAQPVTLGGTATIQTTGQLGFGSTVNVQAGSNLTLTANSYSIANTINGNSANITLKPANVTDDLQLGTGGTGTNIAPVLTKLSNFGNVTIGGADLQGKVTVSGTESIVGNLTILAGGVGGQVDIQAGTNLTTNKNIVINANSNITADGAANLTSTGGKVSLVTPGNLNLTSTTLLKSTTFVELSVGGTFTNPAGLGLIDPSTPYWRLYVPDASHLTGTGFTTSTGFHRYGCTLTLGCATTTSVPNTGDGILFANVPLLDLSNASGNNAYGTGLGNGFGTTVSYSGLINGDSISDANVTGTGSAAFTTTPSKSTSNNVNVGTYNIQADKGTLASSMGYSFDVSPSTSTITVTPKIITTTYTGNTKTYDGTTAETGTTALTGIISSDTVNGSSVATFTDKNAGTSKSLTGTTTISGTDSANYQFSSGTTSSDFSGFAKINTKVVSASLLTNNKTYDDTTTDTGSATVTGIITNDIVTANISGLNFSDKNAGTSKSVTGTYSLSGTDASNYSLATTSATGTATINPKVANISITANDKTYDGTTTATLSGVSSADIYSTDNVILNPTSANFIDKNASTGKTVTATISESGNDSSNYTYVIGNTTANISAKNVSATISANSKTYDGTTNAITSSSVTGLISTDNVSSATSNSQFSDKNAATGKTVTANVALSGTDSSNYNLTTPTATTTADINQKSVTVTLGGSTKVYDGTTVANPVALSSDFISTDNVYASATTANYSDKNAAIGKSITATVSLGGTDASNYSIVSSTVSGTGDITPKTLTNTITANSKTYDGNVAATIASSNLTGIVGTDNVGENVTNATFDNKNAATSKTVTANVALTGSDSANYTVASTATDTNATITHKVIGTTVTISNKTYDGTVAATEVATTTDFISGDSVSVSATGNFNDKNAGTGKQVSVNTVLSGNDSGNYQLATPTGVGSADITKKTVTTTLTANDKTYDATTAATATASSAGFISTDNISEIVSGANFSDKNAGTNKTVTATVALSGADSGNYDLSSSTVNTTANISKLVLTSPTLNVSNKTYDGTTVANATTGTLSGIIRTDDLSSFVTSANFSDKNAAISKTVTATVALSGNDAGNYDLSSSTLLGTGNIDKKVLTSPTVSATGKVYDGSSIASATVGKLSGVIGTDDLSASITSANFDNKNAGVNKVVIANVAITGADEGNYSLSSATSTTVATITPKVLTSPSATVNTKTYDGSTTAQVNVGQVQGVVSGDNLNVGITSANFNDKNAGSGKSVAIILNTSGNDSGNYQLANNNITSTGDIDKKVISVSGSQVVNKTYDGSTVAQVTGSTLQNTIANDNINVSSTGQFSDKNAGTNKAVEVSYVLNGTDSQNYDLSSTSAAFIGNIAQRGLTYKISGNGQTTYTVGKDTTPVGFNSSLSNTVSGDNVVVSGLNFVSHNTPVVPFTTGLYGVGVTLGGTDSTNYFINYAGSSLGSPVTFLSLNSPLSSLVQVDIGQQINYVPIYANGRGIDSKGRTSTSSTSDDTQSDSLKGQRASAVGERGEYQNVKFKDPAKIKDVTNEVVVLK